VSVLFVFAGGGFAKLVFCLGVVVGNYFYTVGGYATFKVPDDFPLGTKREGETQVVTSSRPSLSSPQFLRQH